MKIGILGGTFNPIHVGHLKIAQAAQKKLKLDQVLFVPAFRPPHRPLTALASAKHRLEIVKLALGNHPRFLPSTVEIQRRGKSYSVDTLKRLRQMYKKGTRFFFLIGSDSLHELYSWKKIATLSKLCEFAVLTRAGFQTKGVTPKMLRLPPAVFRRVTRHFLAIRPVKVSATQIRERARKGKPLRGLVPKKVAEYILKNKLYRKRV